MENCALLILARSITHKETESKGSTAATTTRDGWRRVWRTPSTQKRAFLNLSTPNCLLRGSITSTGAPMKSDGLALSHKGFTPKHQLQKHACSATRKTAPFAHLVIYFQALLPFVQLEMISV